MQPSRQTEDKLRRHSALYTRMCLSGTNWEVEVLEADVRRLQKGVVQGAPVVDFHLASVFNRYTEFFPGFPPEVLLLPETTFSSWKSEPGARPTTGVREPTRVSKARHVVFPFHWEKQGRWLLVVLADFGSLLPAPEPAVPAPEPAVPALEPAVPAEPKRTFTILVFDALEARTKPPYHSLGKSFRDFAKALLWPALDIDLGAIADAKVIAPTVVILFTFIGWRFTYQASVYSRLPCFQLTTARLHSQLTISASSLGNHPISSINARFVLIDTSMPGDLLKRLVQSASMVDADWDLPGRAEVVNRFKAFLITHSSIAVSNIRWKHNKRDLGPAVTAGGGGQSEQAADGEKL